MSNIHVSTPPLAVPPTALGRIHGDILATAELVRAPCDSEIVRRFLDVYGDVISTAALSFRTATRLDPELNFRYVELEVPHDPFAMAREARLLPDGSHPVAGLLPEIQQSFPILGYGVDAGATSGLEKIWPFFPHRPQPTEIACGMASLPDAVRGHADFFARYDFDAFSLFAVDYRHRTVNLYFMKAPGTYGLERLARMIADLEFEVPSREILEYCSASIPIYLTFEWDSPRVERLCFGTVFAKPAQVPVHLHPVIRRFVAGAPFATDRRAFIFNVAFSRGGHFFKIENDYSGSMVRLLKQF